MDTYPGARYTIEELSRLVGMSVRNIRAHQERGLLVPPVRHRRVGYYHDGHLRRLEQIKAMQRQGFNLASIVAIIGGCDGNSPDRLLSPVVAQLARDRPVLVAALSRHGVVAYDEDGSLRPVRPKILLAAVGMRRFGLSMTAALQLLTEILDLAACATENLPAQSADGLAELLISAFRLVAEANQGA